MFGPGLREMPAAGVLLLADTQEQDGFNALASSSPNSGGKLWTRQEDGGTPYLSCTNWPYPLFVILGFQVVTYEGLEVLGLMMPERPIESAPLCDTIEGILGAGGVPVLPWGVGKWLGRRGRLVAEAIQRSNWRGRIALSDNANRPAFWPNPRLLRRGRKAGFAVLHGSDPLPLNGEVQRIGSAGVMVPSGPIEGPVTYLRRALLDPDQVQPFGRAMSAAGFLYRQSALRLGLST